MITIEENRCIPAGARAGAVAVISGPVLSAGRDNRRTEEFRVTQSLSRAARVSVLGSHGVALASVTASSNSFASFAAANHLPSSPGV